MIQDHLLSIENTLTAQLNNVQEYLRSITCSSYPIFTSLDIRNSGFKIAHVDANLFPAGFNNLNTKGRKKLKQDVAIYFSTNFPGARNLLIYIENFTRNLKYLESLNVIKEALEANGLNVRFGIAEIEEDRELDNGDRICALKLHNCRITTIDGFVPDVIILNNDLTSGTPDVLLQAAQQVVPPHELGWHARSKANHFKVYSDLLSKFCEDFNIDPWLLSTMFEDCDNVDFKTKKGLECLGKKVDVLLERISYKYKEYNIKHDPYIFVKADKGTFGMGIMTVKNGDDIVNINKKNRHSMHVIKQGKVNEHLIIQEGVPTIERVGDFSAETMSYMCNNDLLEMFFRYNIEKDTLSNLNSSGMSFAPGADEMLPQTKLVISKLAGIASTLEI